jgi:lipopolysaccharide export system permease protein
MRTPRLSHAVRLGISNATDRVCAEFLRGTGRRICENQPKLPRRSLAQFTALARISLRILQRYIWRELALNFAAVSIALLAILLVYQGGAVLARAAELQYPSQVVWRLLALGLVQNLSLLLPFGLVLGIVLALGRLYHESEMVAAQACGLGTGRSYQIVLALALPVAVLAAWLNLWMAPRAAAAETALRAEALRSALQAPLAPGQFRSLNGGRTVVYARTTLADGELGDVFIKRSTEAGVESTVARRARYSLSADGRSQIITLYDGEQLAGQPGNASFRRLRFAAQTIPIPVPLPPEAATELNARRSLDLLGSKSLDARAELQGRMSWPLMALVMAACAVPLARTQPRHGRYARIGWAVLLFALYANLLQVASLWLERARAPAALGLWWVHLLFALLAVALTFGPGIGRRWRQRTASP